MKGFYVKAWGSGLFVCLLVELIFSFLFVAMEIPLKVHTLFTETSLVFILWFAHHIVVGSSIVMKGWKRRTVKLQWMNVVHKRQTSLSWKNEIDGHVILTLSFPESHLMAAYSLTQTEHHHAGRNGRQPGSAARNVHHCTAWICSHNCDTEGRAPQGPWGLRSNSYHSCKREVLTLKML